MALREYATLQSPQGCASGKGRLTVLFTCGRKSGFRWLEKWLGDNFWQVATGWRAFGGGHERLAGSPSLSRRSACGLRCRPPE